MNITTNGSYAELTVNRSNNNIRNKGAIPCYGQYDPGMIWKQNQVLGHTVERQNNTSGSKILGSAKSGLGKSLSLSLPRNQTTEINEYNWGERTPEE